MENWREYPEESTNSENFAPQKCMMIVLKLRHRTFARIGNLLQTSDVRIPFFAKKGKICFYYKGLKPSGQI
jgi:hypothetical protein